MAEKETPLTRQYNQIKAKYPDSILLFRLGDFFETFNEDAIITSKVCGLTLTKRNNGAAGEVPLAGFPWHQLDNYLPKLVRAGYRVAVCDQLEDPKMAKGIVRRGVTEVVTPGIAIGDKLLDTKENNYIVSLIHSTKKNKSIFGFAFSDVSTGEFAVSEVDNKKILDVLDNLSPKEILISKEQKDIILPLIEQLKTKPAISKIEGWFFEYNFALDLLLRHFRVQSLKGFGIDALYEGVIAAGALLHFIRENQQGDSVQIQGISLYNPNEFMLLDYPTRKNLEILFNINPQQQGHTLLTIIDKTKTPMGGRLLKRWISQPLIKLDAINKRLNIVSFFYDNSEITEKIRELLVNIGDLERLVSKISANKANPRDYVNLKNSLIIVKKIKSLNYPNNNEIKSIIEQINVPEELINLLDNALLDEPSVTLGIGRVFKKGFNEKVDEYTYLKYSAKEWLQNFQERERQRTQIQSLKVSFNNVFGYYIEVSKANTNKVPADYDRRQTLTNSERYITPELKEFETKILETESNLLAIEQELIENIRLFCIKHIGVIQQIAQTISELDCFTNFAVVAIENNYTKPIIDDSKELEIVDGRHPVIEKTLKPGTNYQPNSSKMNPESELIHIITGPNMSGKSSYLRQVGLIVLMGQIGCYVPAKYARFGLVDKIFTRVGASDNIIGGESTFMVEMQEAANIVNNATSQSLILLDEVGRGTATFDGISIAWAICEYIQSEIGAKTLFATHYHELQELANLYNNVKNYQIQVIETGNDIIFTHKLVPGGSSNSFGIHVAKMAGLPQKLTTRAEEILEQLQKTSSDEIQTKSKKIDTRTIKPRKIEPRQLSIFEFRDDELREKLQSINIEKITPLQALQLLYELKESIK
mgnify:CR=1 FL=1